MIVCGKGGERDKMKCNEMLQLLVKMVRECSGVKGRDELVEYGLFPSAIAREYNKLDCHTMACVPMQVLQGGGRQTARGHDGDAEWLVRGHTEVFDPVMSAREGPWMWGEVNTGSKWR